MTKEELKAEIHRLIDEIQDEAFLNYLYQQFLKHSENDPEKLIIKLSVLSGLGSEIWKDIDIDDYLNNERDWDK